MLGGVPAAAGGVYVTLQVAGVGAPSFVNAPVPIPPANVYPVKSARVSGQNSEFEPENKRLRQLNHHSGWLY